MCSLSAQRCPAPRSYEELLANWSTRLASGRGEGLLDDVAVGHAADVQRFLINTIEERRRLLTEELSLVALALEGFSELVTCYLREVPRITFTPDYSDSQRFLRWLRRVWPLTAREADFVAYQEAEYACLALARRERAAHVNFQQLLREGASLPVSIAAGGDALAHLNPTRVWSRLAALSPTPEQDAVDAVFFAVGSQIRVAALAGPRATWLRTLSAVEPCSLRVWHARLQNERCGCIAPAAFEAFVQELTDAGLVGIAPKNPGNNDEDSTLS